MNEELVVELQEKPTQSSTGPIRVQRESRQEYARRLSRMTREDRLLCRAINKTKKEVKDKYKNQVIQSFKEWA